MEVFAVQRSRATQSALCRTSISPEMLSTGIANLVNASVSAVTEAAKANQDVLVARLEKSDQVLNAALAELSASRASFMEALEKSNAVAVNLTNTITELTKKLSENSSSHKSALLKRLEDERSHSLEITRLVCGKANPTSPSQ